MTKIVRRMPVPRGSRSETEGRPLAHYILEMIWSNKQISRAEIARRAGLSPSTVSEIVSQLLETGLVAEAGDGPSRGGRRPVLLEFQDDAHLILGVDMGASHVSVVLVNLRGKVYEWEHREHPVRADPEGTRDLILELCGRCLSARNGARRRLLGIGLAVPSPVDPRAPERLSGVVLPAWRGSSGVEGLFSSYGVPVFVDNDANLGALAEYWWGAGRGVADLAYLKLATGIGSGHIIRGEIYRGATGVAGEIGHISIDPDGAQCVCGNAGCLATVVGSAALEARARALLDEYPDSALHQGLPTVSAIEAAALADDPLALRVVEEAAVYLGIVIAGVLNLLNPAMVILGGGFSRLGERLLNPLREAVFRRTLISSIAASDIRTGDLGPQDIALGAATYVLQNALDDPRLFPGMST
jgi:predicted NBD/HSP70 family sugar kinase